MPKVTSCNASLCNALQQWAQLARERELQGNCSSSDPAVRSSCKPSSFTSLKNAFVWRTNPSASGTQQFPSDPLKADPLPEEEVERQQSGGVGQICTEGWKRGVLARLTSSTYVRQMLADNQTRMENITAGIDAVCARAREVEDGLLASIRNGSGAATSACSDWPEACWPVPHMPFAMLSDFPRRKYLVFAMSEEQLSNARTHIIEAARLAQMSNRILVLPKASRSHLSLGRSLPLCAYWDLTKLAATAEWVSPQLFLLLARAALPKASVGFMWVQSPYLQRTAFHYELASEFLGQLLPFAMGHVPLEANTLDVKMPARDDTMALTLKAWSSRDVVVWFKTTWERVKFQPHTDDIALTMLPYQKSLHAMAERLLARLPRPLIAVHFRSEFIAFRVQEDMVSQGGKANASMVQQRLDWCVGEAERLITTVRDSPSHSSAGGNSTTPTGSSSGGNSSTATGSGPSVFIAADVPFNESAAPARSDSWTEMVQWYDGDSRVLQSSSAALHRLRANVSGTVMIDEIMPEVNELDPDQAGEMVQRYDGDSCMLQLSAAALHRLRRNVHGTFFTLQDDWRAHAGSERARPRWVKGRSETPC
ncbi:unnamed protein product [Closterium sp. Naga37s-1]|nr:unnamed protein product [Closterium sp. Naga37s-1]